MFDDLTLDIMRLAGSGYCCAQIVPLLGMQEMGVENPDLLRAASSLCFGLGDCSGPCGVLTGGALLLGLHAGKGTDEEERDPKLTLMLSEYSEWFKDLASGKYGGFSCVDIVDGECGRPNKERCPNLVALGVQKARELLVENGFDPAQGRE